MSKNDLSYNGSQGVFNRRFFLCPVLNNTAMEDLTTYCPDCSRLYALCCPDRDYTAQHGGTCHHYALVFTDGSCIGNGRDDAVAGMGVAIGLNGQEHQWAIPVDDSVDPGSPRTNQRAELLAAIEGLQKICCSNGDYYAKACEWRNNSCVIVVTDSEYVVKGITEYLPTWKENNWRTPQGKAKRPKNADLFLKLDKLVNVLEAKHRINIGSGT
ncbi:ribonuclease H-like domain-containing protein [Hygrophoropsis aurantiaca]|uniref:Ribonuclease H-like domain-containing protein n=2 Tax=Hygrophoropsis aurantiaca TaxID=72124 RepID=A0ACB7ZQN8_9AGAM|nr:ribonuclease H-like domain-containing protein [Hygrophoropsis aurantiaca]KAH7903395.1 ribonuclease H-like domain-containing protein [Hygrophoropsis aurantiaca]